MSIIHEIPKVLFERMNATTKLLLSYLKFSSPKFIIFFTCWYNRDKINFQNELNQLNIRTAFFSGNLNEFHLENYERVSYVLDMSCPASDRILFKASTLKKFSYLDSWLLLFNSQINTFESIQNIFENVTTRMDMDVKLAFLNKNDIFEVYNPGLGVGLKLQPWGTYNFKNDTIRKENCISYYESRKNMTGVLIRAVNVITYPYKTDLHEYMMDPKLKRYDIYSKFHYQLFLVLEEIHGFHHNTTVVSSWFGFAPGGQDGGMGELFYNDTVDMSSAGGIMRLVKPDRVFFYDFIMPYYKFRSSFLFRNPGVVKPNLKEVLKPFTPVSWYATLVTSLVVCICIEIAYLVEKYMIDSQSDWVMSVFITVAVFSQQSLETVPKNIAGRIIFFSLMAMSILLYNYYTSSLVSSLINTAPEVFTTIRELYESSLRVGIELQSYTITYILDRSKWDYYLKMLNATKIYPDGKDRPNFFLADDGISMVKQGGFAYHAEAITAYPIIAQTFEQDAICDLAEINFINSDTSIVTQKRSPYKKLLQISLRKMWQSGIFKKVHLFWVGRKPECFSSARVISVGKNDLFLPYFLLFVGSLLAFLILFLEMIWKKFHKRKIPQTVFPYTN